MDYYITILCNQYEFLSKFKRFDKDKFQNEVQDIINNFHPLNMSNEGAKEYRQRFVNVEVFIKDGRYNKDNVYKFNTNILNIKE